MPTPFRRWARRQLLALYGVIYGLVGLSLVFQDQTEPPARVWDWIPWWIYLALSCSWLLSAVAALAGAIHTRWFTIGWGFLIWTIWLWAVMYLAAWAVGASQSLRPVLWLGLLGAVTTLTARLVDPDDPKEGTYR